MWRCSDARIPARHTSAPPLASDWFSVFGTPKEYTCFAGLRRADAARYHARRGPTSPSRSIADGRISKTSSRANCQNIGQERFSKRGFLRETFYGICGSGRRFTKGDEDVSRNPRTLSQRDPRDPRTMTPETAADFADLFNRPLADVQSTWNAAELGGSAVVNAWNEIKRSRRFQEWQPPATGTVELATERHHSRAEIAAMWDISEDTVTTIFEHETDVIWITKPAKHKRRYRTMRVPHSVLLRVHRRLTNGKG